MGKDGRYRWMLGTGGVIDYDDEGNPLQMTGVHVVIDEMKNVQHELNIAKEEAEKAVRIKSDFLANMSHEIRTPMNAVIGFNDLLLNTELTAKQRNYVDNVSNSSKNLLSIINDILDFSKIESGRLIMEKTGFSLKDVLARLVSLVSQHALKKKLELIVYINPEIPDALIGDPYRLGQVLLNLTENAIKFTSSGEVFVNVDLVQNGNTAGIRFSVKDTGIGMTEEQLDNLFIAFQQADASTTRNYGGTGLGLAISRSIINMMNSDIEVESKFGVGS